MNKRNYQTLILLILFTLTNVVFGPVGLPLMAAGPDNSAPGVAVAKNDWNKRYRWHNGIELGESHLPNRYYPTADVAYPVVTGLKNETIQRSLNQDLEKQCLSFSEGKSLLGKADLTTKTFKVSYEVTANCNNVLCLSLRRYLLFNFTGFSDPEPYATLIYDLTTGRRLGLKDLFSPGSDFLKKINNEISRQIWEGHFDETSLKKPFTGIDLQQPYYINNNSLTIIFPPQNPYFKANSVPANGLRFSILAKCLPELNAYEKYYDPTQNIYTPQQLSKIYLENDLTVSYRKLIPDPQKYFELHYLQVSDYNDDLVSQKINDLLKRDVQQILTQKDPGWYQMENRGNFGGYLSIVVYHEETIKTYCFDLKTGENVRLSALFMNPAECKRIIDQIIIQYYGAAGYPGYDAIDAKISFSFNEGGVVLEFPKDMPFIKQGQEHSIWTESGELKANLKVYN